MLSPQSKSTGPAAKTWTKSSYTLIFFIPVQIHSVSHFNGPHCSVSVKIPVGFTSYKISCANNPKGFKPCCHVDKYCESFWWFDLNCTTPSIKSTHLISYNVPKVSPVAKFWPNKNAGEEPKASSSYEKKPPTKLMLLCVLEQTKIHPSCCAELIEVYKKICQCIKMYIYTVNLRLFADVIIFP